MAGEPGEVTAQLPRAPVPCVQGEKTLSHFTLPSGCRTGLGEGSLEKGP